MKNVMHLSRCNKSRRDKSRPAPTGRGACPLADGGHLGAMWDAWGEALAAHRQYEHLTSRGVPHNAALRESLGLGRIPHADTRHAAKLLYLAGKA
jgi:hypothetical protein